MKSTRSFSSFGSVGAWLGFDPVYDLTRRLHDNSLLLHLEILVANPIAERFALLRLKWSVVL